MTCCFFNGNWALDVNDVSSIFSQLQHHVKLFKEKWFRKKTNYFYFFRYHSVFVVDKKYLLSTYSLKNMNLFKRFLTLRFFFKCYISDHSASFLIDPFVTVLTVGQQMAMLDRVCKCVPKPVFAYTFNSRYLHSKSIYVSNIKYQTTGTR